MNNLIYTVSHFHCEQDTNTSQLLSILDMEMENLNMWILWRIYKVQFFGDGGDIYIK